MPEGPEVKISTDFLKKNVREVKSINIESAPYKKKFSQIIKIANKHLTKKACFFCIGKNIFLSLSKKNNLHIHLGMTGSFTFKKQKHNHLSFSTPNGKIFFNDIRRFGFVNIVSNETISMKFNKKIDILNDNYDISTHINLLNNISSNLEICKILLNQKFFPGIGNYLKSEILFALKIHPNRKWKTIKKNRYKDICFFTQKITTEAYKKGGAELRDFKNPNSKSNFILKIYGRDKTDNDLNVKKIKSKDNRTSFYCSLQT